MKKRVGLALCLIYISVVCAFRFDGFNPENSSATDAWILFSISVCFTYGVLALHRDIVLFGWRWIIDSFDRSLGISEMIDDIKKWRNERKNNR